MNILLFLSLSFSLSLCPLPSLPLWPLPLWLLLRFLDTSRSLDKEAGPALKKYDVCDNIDLNTVLQVLVVAMTTVSN